MESPWRTEALPELESRIWEALADAARRPGAAWRTPVFATAGPDGTGVTARVVVLRTLDRVRRELVLYTDSRSPKVEALGRLPDVAWTFYDPVVQVQLRATGTARVHRDDAVTEAAWAGVPGSGRRDYACRSAPGTPVAAPIETHDFTGAMGDHFAVVVTRVGVLDWLWLAPDGHRRAAILYNVSGESEAHWLVP